MDSNQQFTTIITQLLREHTLAYRTIITLNWFCTVITFFLTLGNIGYWVVFPL